jgi:hypothetical protein
MLEFNNHINKFKDEYVNGTELTNRIHIYEQHNEFYRYVFTFNEWFIILFASYLQKVGNKSATNLDFTLKEMNSTLTMVIITIVKEKEL